MVRAVVAVIAADVACVIAAGVTIVVAAGSKSKPYNLETFGSVA